MQDEIDFAEPVLPYAGTSGFSGSDTSEQRARERDRSGATRETQRGVYLFLMAAGTNGATWKELSDHLGLHHGTVSGALSVLHKAGFVARLSERRERCKVYVAKPFVVGRPTEEQGRPARSITCTSCGAHNYV